MLKIVLYRFTLESEGKIQLTLSPIKSGVITSSKSLMSLDLDCVL